jgi:hypothetical protein
MNKVGKVREIAFHRNGVCGAGFYAVRFTGAGDVAGREFVATVFDTPGHCAVLAIDRPQDGVAFGANSWRGDNFEPELRAAIAKQNDEGKSNRIGQFSAIPVRF